MTGGIPLSKKHGVNPSIEVCSNCGKETGTLALVGRCNEYKCEDCGNLIYGRSIKETTCPKCNGCRIILIARDVAVPMQLTGGLCDDCARMEKECADEVARGGILWKCEDCGSHGAIRAEADVAKAVRDKMGILPPRPCGITFTKEQCPVCSLKTEEV